MAREATAGAIVACWPWRSHRVASPPRSRPRSNPLSLGAIRVANLLASNRATATTRAQPCSGLFCFIGAEPATSWLTGIATEDNGFIRTDVQLNNTDLGPAWADLGRTPLPFETNVPGVFAVGDVRSGSMKRVAAATGEGASAIASVHKAIATLA